MNFCVAPFLQGCGTGGSLIMAIGTQNAFVLKQGLLRNHVFMTALACSLGDVILITLGVGGFGEIIVQNDLLMLFARYGGGIFLFWFGAKSFYNAFQNNTIQLDKARPTQTLRNTLVTIFVVTFLNPHAYVDAVVLLGSISAQFPGEERFFFGLGAIVASFVWFFSLAYGARLLAPLFTRPLAWKILDILIGCIVWGIGISLIFPDCLC